MKCRTAPRVSCQAQPDAAQLVHGPAVRRVQRQRPLLMHPRRVEFAGREADLAGEEMHVRFVRRKAARLAGRSRGDIQPSCAERRLRHADVGLPVPGSKPARFHPRAQRLGIVVGVQHRIAGQPVWPLVRGVQGHRAVGRVDGLLMPPRAQMRPGEQAPCPGALGLRRHQPGQQAAGLVVPLHVQHRVGPREFLRELDHDRTVLISDGASSGSSPGRRRRRPRWRTARRSWPCRTRPPATA